MSKHFGGLAALTDVSLHIRRGEIYGLIGPNGAGKTTLFNVSPACTSSTRASFSFDGIAYARPASRMQVAQAGIARTFQNIRLFANMTALENVMVGRHVRTRAGVLGAHAAQRARRAPKKRAIAQRARELLRLRRHRRARARRWPSTCPTATSAAWRSPARWPPIRSCWRSTSRPPA